MAMATVLATRPTRFGPGSADERHGSEHHKCIDRYCAANVRARMHTCALRTDARSFAYSNQPKQPESHPARRPADRPAPSGSTN